MAARRSRRERGERRAKRAEEGFRQLPRRRLVNTLPTVEILSADQIEAIHVASLEILRDMGVNFLLDEARDTLVAAQKMGEEQLEMDDDYEEEEVEEELSRLGVQLAYVQQL